MEKMEFNDALLIDDEQHGETAQPKEKEHIEAAETQNAPKKRGRPKGKKPIDEEKPKNERQQNIFEDLKKQVEENKVQGPPQENISQNSPEIFKNLIDGKILILIMDAVVPGAIQFLFKKLKEVNIAEIKLSSSQKISIEPLADEIAKLAQTHISPLYAFMIVSGLMYMENANDAMSKRARK